MKHCVSRPFGKMTTRPYAITLDGDLLGAAIELGYPEDAGYPKVIAIVVRYPMASLTFIHKVQSDLLLCPLN